eukprot:COSAG06_NODE_9419_length_1906_cov_4.458771_3_plen_84_part_00
MDAAAAGGQSLAAIECVLFGAVQHSVRSNHGNCERRHVGIGLVSANFADGRPWTRRQASLGHKLAPRLPGEGCIAHGLLGHAD